MRVFQFHSFYLKYLNYFNAQYPEASHASYAQRRQLLLNHRFQAAHILLPMYEDDATAWFTVANDPFLQLRWAREKGLATTSLKAILLAQIEEHRAEVVYALDPITYNSQFVRQLPGCVRHTACWLGAPDKGADLSAYDLRLCNFPPFFDRWQQQGQRSAWFSPSHDPAMNAYADQAVRPIDISFVGQYSALHTARNRLLERVAALSERYFVSFRLMSPKWKHLSDRRGLNRIPLPIHYLPQALRLVNGPSVFGLNMYEVFSQSKIVINAAIDISGQHRGNMRCFEALGCGACMVSDAGIYPDGLTPGEHFAVYHDSDEALDKIEALLQSPELRLPLAAAGRMFIEDRFSKQAQWQAFQKLFSF